MYHKKKSKYNLVKPRINQVKKLKGNNRFYEIYKYFLDNFTKMSNLFC